MTGQDGGFRAAAARFSAGVDAALTRARRAASEAKAQSAGFRESTRELAEQAKRGRLRGVRRDQVEPTTAGPRAAAANFRQVNGLPDALAAAELPEAGVLIGRLPAVEPAREPEDEDFSQRVVLVDVDGWEEPEPAVRVVDEPAKPSGIDSPGPPGARPAADDDDFSQQRILLDATEDPYRPDAFPGSVFDRPDEQNRS
jgi:hypothetical protein